VSGEVVDQAAEIRSDGIGGDGRARRCRLHDHQRFDLDAAAAVAAAAQHIVPFRRPAFDGQPVNFGRPAVAIGRPAGPRQPLCFRRTTVIRGRVAGCFVPERVRLLARAGRRARAAAVADTRF